MKPAMKICLNGNALLLVLLALAACSGPAPTNGGTVTAIAVSPESITLEIGMTQVLTASVSGSGDFDRTVSWGTSDEAIATVDGTGHVTAVAAGSANIIARSITEPSIQGSAHVTVPTGTVEECPEPGQPVSIPDEYLLEALLRALDADAVTSCELAKLESIVAQNHGIENVEGLQHATGLKEIDLMMNMVSDLSPIADLGLEILNLGSNQVTDLSPLSSMSTLRKLELQGVSQLDDLTPLANLVNLEVLRISDTSVTDLAVLDAFQALHTLSVGAYLRSMPSEFSVLTRIPELESLYAIQLPVQALGLLKDIPKLRHLQLQTIEAYPDVSDIAEVTQLETLTIRLPPGTELDVVGGMSNLTGLTVAGSFVTSLAPLLPLTEFKGLDIRHNCLPENLTEDSAFITLINRGVGILHEPQRASRDC